MSFHGRRGLLDAPAESRAVGPCFARAEIGEGLMDSSLKFSLSRQDAELVGQALDVYATTLMCAPLGLGLDILLAVRGIRERLDAATSLHEAAREAADDPDGNIVLFARG